MTRYRKSFLNFFVILLGLILHPDPNTVWAAESDSKISCSNLKLVKDLQAYMSCQSSEKIDSCSSLLSDVKSITGQNHLRPGAKLSDSQKNALQKFAREPEKFAALVRQLTTPENLMKIAEGSAIKIIDSENISTGAEIEQVLKEKLIMPVIKEKLRASGVQFLTSKSAAFLQQKIAMASAQFVKSTINKSVGFGLMLLNPEEGMGELLNMVTESIASNVAGLVIGPLTALLATTSPLGCSAEDETNINVQPQGGSEGCTPVYEFDRRVATFLNNVPPQPTT